MSKAAEFSAQIDIEFEGMLDELRTVIRVIALEALKRIVQRTPVLTGRARGNWYVSIGGSGFEVSTDIDKNGTVTISRGSSVIATYNDQASFPVISIYNNLPYINRLENGYSNQSPAGMVVVTAAELQTEVSA
jgi:hypothetical protein